MYVSLDIETGGLNHGMDILQIAMVKNDRYDIMECSHLDIIIKKFVYKVEPFAAAMHPQLWNILKEGTDPRIVDGYKAAWAKIGAFLGVAKNFALGKNVGLFDLPFMANHGFQWERFFRHRLCDVGTLYSTPEGIPSLKELMEKYPEVTIPGDGYHDALWDARLTLLLARKAWES